VALGDKPRREAPGSCHTRKPQPFVEPLPQRHPLTLRHPRFLNKYPLEGRIQAKKPPF
jgi:hypothetical protein